MLILRARILEGAAIPFSRGSSQTRDWTPDSCIADTFFTIWTIREDMYMYIQFSSVQLLSCVRLFATPWIAARQASLSITNSQSSPRLNVHRVSDAIQPSHPLLSPSPPAPNPSQHQSYPMSQLFTWGGHINVYIKYMPLHIYCVYI